MTDIIEIFDKEEKLDSWHNSKKEISGKWISNQKKYKNRKINQGEVYFCEIGENIGHEQNKHRPVLVVSENRYNKNGMVTIVPLTKTLKKNSKNGPVQKTHYFLKQANNLFLHNDSAVLCEHVKSVSVSRIDNYLGKINKKDFNLIQIRLKSLFGLK